MSLTPFSSLDVYPVFLDDQVLLSGNIFKIIEYYVFKTVVNPLSTL
jgi:hypothetical protein